MCRNAVTWPESIHTPGRYLVCTTQVRHDLIISASRYALRASPLNCHTTMHKAMHVPSKADAQGWELKTQNEAALLASSREDMKECKGEAVQMQPGIAKLPPGTKLLKAAGSGFLIAPLGHLRDETYSTYFNFRH